MEEYHEQITYNSVLITHLLLHILYCIFSSFSPVLIVSAPLFPRLESLLLVLHWWNKDKSFCKWDQGQKQGVCSTQNCEVIRGCVEKGYQIQLFLLTREIRRGINYNVQISFFVSCMVKNWIAFTFQRRRARRQHCFSGYEQRRDWCHLYVAGKYETCTSRQ